MKMRLLLLVLACASSAAFAEWTQLGIGNQRNTSYFLDLATMQKAEVGKARISYLVDMRSPGECENTSRLYLSSTGEHEFDCRARTFRTVSCTRYSGQMGGGEVVSVTDEPGEWSPVPPRSKAARMYKLACGSR
jgi:hypothetical protein